MLKFQDEEIEVAEDAKTLVESSRYSYFYTYVCSIMLFDFSINLNQG